MSSDGRSPEETFPDVTPVQRTLLAAPACTDLDRLDAQVAFLGVPYDIGAGVPGARFGPNAVRDVKAPYEYAGRDGSVGAGYYDVELDRQRLAGVTMADCGNVFIAPADVERNLARITRAARRIVARDALLVAIGGDHSVTPAVVRGLDRFERLDIVQFDAHTDFLDHFQGLRWTNGMALRRCAEFPWVGDITQVGIRSVRWKRSLDEARDRGNRIVTAERFRQLGPEAAMDFVPASDAIYVTLDIDALDASICRGTGAPELGGLSFLEMRSALRALARRGRVVGFDIVEVAPPLDPSGLTAKVAAELLVEMLASVFAPLSYRPANPA